MEDRNFVFRKTAHITEYFVLTLWAFRALQYGKPRITLKNIAMGMVIAVLYACTDEIHQAFVPHRSSSFNDVMIDSIGTALACGIVLVWKGHQHLVRALFSSPPTDNHT
ncbi:MAG: VanZ family protein [Armatimonadetes bacterium]|nr:VanZ family protein [Armatimonadota bacterium]